MNARRERFVLEYLVDLNATAAYRRTYPSCSEATARRNGHKLLADPAVEAAIAAAQAERSRNANITGERVLLELARIAFADHRKLYHADGRLKAPHELDDDTAATIASSEVEEKREGKKATVRARRVKQWDKREALNLLGKHLGLFTDRVRIEGEVKTSPTSQIDLNVLSDEKLYQLRDIITEAKTRSADGGETSEAQR